MVMYMTNVADVPNWLLLLQQAGFEGCAHLRWRCFTMAACIAGACNASIAHIVIMIVIDTTKFSTVVCTKLVQATAVFIYLLGTRSLGSNSTAVISIPSMLY
jgi:hypothetical protein